MIDLVAVLFVVALQVHFYFPKEFSTIVNVFDKFI